MSAREIVRTLKLSTPIYDGDEILELEFAPATARLMRELEEAKARNDRGKGRFRSPSFVLLSHVTGVSDVALEGMTFGDFQKASEIAAEVSGIEVGDDEDENDSPGKSD